ncbi:MAG: plastocyanin/azurin family copper-binding protein [Gemmatimonadales bacterium]
MRVSVIVAGAALVLAACGGEKKETASDTTTTTAPMAAPAAAATGARHEVQMMQEGTTYKFSPADLTIKAGDVVVFKNVSGGAHNVAFKSDSIPAGAEAILDAAIADKMGPLSSALIAAPGDSLVVSFAGAPVGAYHFTCTPHMAMGMHGMITVQ